MRTNRLVPPAWAAMALLALPASADSAWTIPGIVNAAGLNGTHFVSDLTVTNPGGATAHVTLSFFPAGSSGSKNLTLSPGQTVGYADVAGATFGVSGAGALSVSSDQPLLIRAKTYNTAASGTYGVALPVVTSDRLLAPGDAADSLWISQDASGSSGYRTNVAVVFPDDSGGEATVTVYDADGNEAGSQDFSLDAPGLKQYAVGSFAGAVPVGRAQVQVIRGRAAGYSVVVDNVTGDSSLFAFEQLPAGWQDVLVNGVARANGRNGAFFRTDGRFYNPTDADATIQVAFHASGNANPSPATASFVLPAGKIRDVVDVLDSLLGLPVGSAGALRFQSNGPVAVLCRTSNVDPSGARPGTFGSQQKPVPLLSFVSSADAGAAITGIRQDAAFRTNVGFTAGADGAQYTLTLKDAAGATVATTSASLGAFGWTQPGIQDLFPTATIPGKATLNVKVTAGSVDVFDSSIDNLSGDPVVTPIAPLPASIPSSATIGPQGGSIRSDDGALTLKIPAGALGAPTPFSIATVSNDAPGALGAAYDLSPGGLSLAKPALLALRYGVAGLPVDGIDGVSLAVKGDAGWGGLTGGRIDTISRSLLIPLRNTNPALALAAPRRTHAQDGSNSARFGAAASMIVTNQKWLPTGGKMTLSVVFQVQPSSAGQEVLVVRLGEQPGTSVTWTAPNVGTISSYNNSTTTYTAPSSIKDVFSKVNLTVKAYIKANGQLYENIVSFHVIRRRWSLLLGLEMHLLCVGSNKDYSAVYANLTEQFFHFNDDLTFVADGPPVPDKGAVTVGSCDPVCKASVSASPSDIHLTNMAPVFLRFAGFLVLGTASVTNATPAVAITCDRPHEGRSHTTPGEDWTVPVPGVFALSNSIQSSPPIPAGAALRFQGFWRSVP